MRQFISELLRLLEQGRKVASAVIVWQDGSAPRGPGARLLADDSGLLFGTVGGGLAEARVLEWCADAVRDGISRFHTVDMDGKLAAGADMICGGRVSVLVECLQPADMDFYGRIAETMKTGEGGLFCLSLNAHAPQRMFIPANTPHWPKPIPRLCDLPDHATIRSLPASLVPDSILETDSGSNSTDSTEVCDWFVEPILPPWRLILAGGGHVSRPTAHMAHLVGFEVIVLDDRAEFATAERFPAASHTCTVPSFAHCFSTCPPNARTCVVILTRGHVHDGTVLEQALHSSAGYIGMIGSKRKRDQVYTALQEKGFSAKALAQVHCPVGLAIKAQTPEEIAVSILAELILFKNSLRDQGSTD